MKCPKCGYISFDYNQACLKCNRDLSDQQEKMNLLDFKPDPPSLLGILIGEANEPPSDFYTGGIPSDMKPESDTGIPLDDAVSVDPGEVVFDDGQDTDLDFETRDSADLDFSEEMAGDTLAEFELDESPDEDSEETTLLPDDGEEEISLELDDITLEKDTGEMSGSGEVLDEIVDIEKSIDELSLDDSGSPEEMSLEGEGEKTGKSLTDDHLESYADEEGEPEAGDPVDTSPEEPPVEKIDRSIEFGDISIDGLEMEEEGESLELGDVSLDEPEEGMESKQILENLASENSSLDKEWGGMDGDIPSDQPPAEDAERSFELGDLSLDRLEMEEEGESLEVGDISLVEPLPDASEGTIIPEEPSLKKEEIDEDNNAVESIEIAADGLDSEDLTQTLVLNKPPWADEASIEKEAEDEATPSDDKYSTEPDDLADVVFENQESDDGDENDFSFDLDDLELELDFDEPENDKS